MTMTAPTSTAHQTRTRTRPADPDALEVTAAPETDQPTRTRGRAEVTPETRRAGRTRADRARGRVRAAELDDLETGRTRTRTRPAEPEGLEQPAIEQPAIARPRTAAAERAYARRAQREGRRAPRRAAEPEDSTAGRASFVVLIIGLLVVGVAATLWLSTQAIADSYRLDEAKQAATDLSERAEVLQREVTKMDSPSEIARRAKELGMVLPDDPARLVVQPDGSVVVVGEPKAAEAPAPPPPPAGQDQATAPPAEEQPAADNQAPPQQRAG
jgi:hypothetical protein